MKCEDCKLEHCYRLTDIPFDKDPCSTCKVKETGETYGFKDICKKCNKDNCYFDPREEEKIELKPCPFCGGTASIIHDGTGEPNQSTFCFAVTCDNCYVTSAFCKAEKEAKKWWNRRADNGKNQ